MEQPDRSGERAPSAAQLASPDALALAMWNGEALVEADPDGGGQPGARRRDDSEPS